jgi:hypothetical protein
MPADKVDREADALYGLPPGDFTRARDELARRLRKEGRRADADAVKALRKPTAAAWALNQLARRRPKEVDRLLAAGKRLRKAHEELLSGGDRSALQDASAAERELVDTLTRDATAVAAEAGTASSTALDERIRNTLHAAALDEQTAADLAAGRMVRDREAVGMFGAATAAPETTRKTRAADKGRSDTGARDLAKRRRDLERELASARAEEQKAQRAHARAVKASERAGRRADEARRRAEEARDGLREAEQLERDTAKSYDCATRAVAAAEKKLR